MNDSLKRFKEEIEKRGFFRKFKSAANLIPPPPCATDEQRIEIQKIAARDVLMMYAKTHEGFGKLMAEAALDHLMDTVLTDDLFALDAGFIPTAEEQANINRANETAKLLTGLFDRLAGIL